MPLFHPSYEDLAVLAEVNVYGRPQGQRGYEVTDRKIAQTRRHVFGVMGFGGCKRCQEVLESTEESLRSESDS